MTIALIFGGRSSEHSVSVATGVLAFDRVVKKYDVLPVYIDKNGVWRAGKINERPLVKNVAKGKIVRFEGANRHFFVGRKKYYIDCALLCLHGMNGEDGTVQGMLKIMGIPFTGSSVCASAEGLDKECMKDKFVSHNLPYVPYICVTKEDFVENNEAFFDRVEELGYPIILKPARAGSSIGICTAKDKDELVKALSVAFEYDVKVVAEKMLSDFIEVNCAVIKDGRTYYVSDVEQPLKQGDFLGYKDKYAFGAKLSKHKIPADISEQVQTKIKDLARQTFRALDCAGVARVDFMIAEDGKIYVNEINTIPGTLASYMFVSHRFTFEDICDMLISDAVYEHEREQGVKYSYESELFAVK